MNDAIYAIEELQKLDVRLHWIYRRTLRKGDGSGISHVPDNYLTLWLIEEGEVRVETEGQGTHHAYAGQLFICDQGTKRIQNFSEDAKIISVWMDIKYAEHGQPLFSNLPLVVDESAYPALKKYCCKIIELLKQNGVVTIFPLTNEKLSLPAAIELQSKTMTFFSALLEVLMKHDCHLNVKKPVDDRVKAAMNILSELGYTGTIPYDALRQSCGLSRVQLDRLFVKELGMTPKDYLAQKCVQSAISLLASGNYTVKEVAYRLNFMNPGHFCTWFKRQTGKSPKHAKLLFS